MQGFLQMSTNAIIASIAVPLLAVSWMNYVLGQALFLLLAMGLWYFFGRRQI